MSASNPTGTVDLQPLHTFGLQASAKGLRLLQNTVDLQNYARAVKAGESPLLLGEGSNTVFLNEVLPAVVWKMALKGRQYLGCDGEHHHLRVFAGENWHQLVEWTLAQGWAGLENLALIPGSVGASPVQNIGAYGVELKDRISAVHVFDLRSESDAVLTREACEFSYRESVFKQCDVGRYVITAVDFALPVLWKPMLDYGDLALRVKALGTTNPLNVMRAVCAIRTEKLPDPVVLGNSGSFFKNPIVTLHEFDAIKALYSGVVHYPAGEDLVKLAAGWLIDQCGLKGHVHRGVGVYEKQALILVNHGSGRGEDLLALIDLIQRQVEQRFGVRLEPEPNLIRW